MDMIRKNLDASVDAVTSDGIVAKISTNSVDRDGEVLLPQGMNATQYVNNPVLFWNHDYGEPIGNVKNISRTKDAVYGTLSFLKRPNGAQGEFFAETVESMVKQGVVRGVSVGFVPEDGGVRNPTPQDRKSFGGEVKRVYNRWKLLEVSVAPLPANQDALIQAVDKGMLSAVQVKSLFGITVPKAKESITLQERKRERIVLTEPRTKRMKYDSDAVVRAEIARLRGQIYL